MTHVVSCAAIRLTKSYCASFRTIALAALAAVLLALFVCFPIAPAQAAALLSPPEADTPAPPAPTANSIEIDREAGEDARIKARLADIFANVPGLTKVSVSVNGGVVSLGGTAPDAAAQQRAATIAAGVEGVVTVENAIERDVSVDVGEQVGGLQDRLQDFLRMLPLIGAALLVALLIAAIGYLLASFTGLWRRVASNSFLAELIASALRFVFLTGGVVVALDMIGAGALMGAVLGGAGVVGVALGFAMRDTIENYVASLMLSLRQPFRPNDLVMIDEQEGRVVRLTSRATILMTLDGNHLRIPNSTVFKAVILNYTRNPQRRFSFELGVDADDDAEAARALGRATFAQMPFILANPAPEVRIEAVGDSNIVLRFLGWIDQDNTSFHQARSRAIAVMKSALEHGGFALPEPIYRLRFDPRTTPLPFQNVGPNAGSGQDGAGPQNASGQATGAASAAPFTGSEKPATKPMDANLMSDDHCLDATDEIAQMVDDERAETSDEDDLLDTSRPVE